MSTKSFFLSGITGTFVYFLLGGLFYGVIFKDIYPNEGQEGMSLIALGCLFYAFFYAFMNTKWAQIVSFKEGLFAGFILGLLYALSMNFFMYSSQAMDINKFAIVTLLDSISTAIMFGVIAIVYAKTK